MYSRVERINGCVFILSFAITQIIVKQMSRDTLFSSVHKFSKYITIVSRHWTTGYLP